MRLRQSSLMKIGDKTRLTRQFSTVSRKEVDDLQVEGQSVLFLRTLPYSAASWLFFFPCLDAATDVCPIFSPSLARPNREQFDAMRSSIF
jgi:hypothetical protein